jgi:thymidylate synthase
MLLGFASLTMLGRIQRALGAAGRSAPLVKKRHEEHQYLDLIREIASTGTPVEGRNGGVTALVGANMKFNLSGGTIPILTTKRVAWKTCFRELLWFVRGQTDNAILQEQGVGIWTGNASRQFLDSRGLDHYREGDLGPVYGHQWRHFNAPYGSCDDNYAGQGVDQLQYVVSALQDPSQWSSRRLVVSAWNPCQIDIMALPPCHALMQFNVLDGMLHCSVYQRSADVGLGVPFNIASYAMLTHLVAHHAGLGAGALHHHFGNCHVYDGHLDRLLEQAERVPYRFPTVSISAKKDDIGDYEVSDFRVSGYKHHPTVTLRMRE